MHSIITCSAYSFDDAKTARYIVNGCFQLHATNAVVPRDEKVVNQLMQ